MSENNIKQFIQAARQYLLGLMPAEATLADMPAASCKAH